MLKTVAQARASTLKNISGVPVSSPAFLERVNEATEALMDRGDWSGTIVPIYVCASRGCVVWPRYVGSVRKMNICQAKISIRSVWDHFINDYHSSSWQGCLGSECKMVGRGKACCYNDIYGDGRYVRAYTQAQADVGKVVTLFGTDNNNQPLRTNNPDNTWSDGIKLVLAGPPNNYVQSPMFIRRIDRVLKDVTQGPVLLYAFLPVAGILYGPDGTPLIGADGDPLVGAGGDPDQGILEDLAVYEPSEINPDYVKYSLNIPCCATSQGVLAVVKLKFIPATADTDLVLIESLRALKYMIQAIKFSEAGDDENATVFEAKAIRELNLKEANDNPDAQMSIETDPFNGVWVSQNTW